MSIEVVTRSAEVCVQETAYKIHIAHCGAEMPTQWLFSRETAAYSSVKTLEFFFLTNMSLCHMQYQWRPEEGVIFLWNPYRWLWLPCGCLESFFQTLQSEINTFFCSPVLAQDQPVCNFLSTTGRYFLRAIWLWLFGQESYLISKL